MENTEMNPYIIDCKVTGVFEDRLWLMFLIFLANVCIFLTELPTHKVVLMRACNIDFIHVVRNNLKTIL